MVESFRPGDQLSGRFDQFAAGTEEADPRPTTDLYLGMAAGSQQRRLLSLQDAPLVNEQLTLGNLAPLSGDKGGVAGQTAGGHQDHAVFDLAVLLRHHPLGPVRDHAAGHDPAGLTGRQHPPLRVPGRRLADDAESSCHPQRCPHRRRPRSRHGSPDHNPAAEPWPEAAAKQPDRGTQR